MSAIAGIITQNRMDNLDISNAINRMCDIQLHRGPDGKSIWKDAGIALGCCALNIEDTKNHNCSISNETKEIWVVFDGFIYNYMTLYEELSKHHHFLTDTHSEIIIHLYEEYGTECMGHINGTFAFAIYDCRSKTLLLARDRLGERPLFFYKNNGLLLFASEMKALMKTKLVNKDLDLEAIYHFLFLKSFVQPETPFRNIKALSPGNYAIYNVMEEEISIFQYWDIPTIVDNYIDRDHAIDKFYKLFTCSLQSSNPMGRKSGVLLSGGLDSSLMVSAIKDNLNCEIETFTVVFDSYKQENSDSYYADLMSNHIGVQNHQIVFTPENLLGNIINILWSADYPICGAFQTYYSAKAAKENDIHLLYTGEGADSIYGLDKLWNYFAILEKYASILKIIPTDYRGTLYDILYNLFSEFAGLSPSFPVLGKGFLFFRRYFEFKKGIFRWKSSRISEKELMGIINFDSGNYSDLESVGDLHRKYYRRCNSHLANVKGTYTVLKTYTPNHALTPFGSVCAGFSSEPRFPYLNHELIEFASLIPPKIKGTNKEIAHIIGKKLNLPSEILNRKKAQFSIPFDNWFKTEMKDFIISILRSSNRDFLNYDEIEIMYKGFCSSKKAVRWSDIWAFVALELWLRLYYDNIDIEKPAFTANDLML